MKKYYIKYPRNFGNEYDLRYVDGLDDELRVLEQGYERIAKKEALKKCRAEEARERKNARQREYAKRTKYAANNKYQKKGTTSISIRMINSTDSDIIACLENQPNKAGYIKQLIRDDIQRKN